MRVEGVNNYEIVLSGISIEFFQKGSEKRAAGFPPFLFFEFPNLKLGK